jgi:chemotaxis methyl-accepting protein methylase
MDRRVLEYLQHIEVILLRSSGMDVSKYDPAFLVRSLQKRVLETGCGTVEEYCALLEQSTPERSAFTDSLQISYSEFFRNPLTFAVLEQIVLPSIMLKKSNSGRREIRVWSAACAGGQEAYSLAILLEELIQCRAGNCTYRIFATDQSEKQVLDAKRGLYAAPALNGLNFKRAGAWFTSQGEDFAVLPELKEHIEFSTFDLLNEELNCPPASIFGDFDLVVCANFLFYYKDRYRKTVLGKTGTALAHDGYLISGETEREILMREQYREVFPQSAIFQT